MGKEERGFFKSGKSVVPDPTVTPVGTEEVHLLQTQCFTYVFAYPFKSQ